MTVADLPGSRTLLTIVDRRRARLLLYVNGGLWAVGNGLLSSMLVIYLALELGAPRIGLGISFIVAAPQIAGLLRLAAPALIGRVADRKRFCIGTYAASCVVLMALPFLASRRIFTSPGVCLAALVIMWCTYHLLEYLGTVALWSWMADLVPQPVRGRFLGYRERWMVTGQAVAMLAGGGFAWLWHRMAVDSPRWIGYAVPAVLGAWCMLLAIVPLCRVPAVTGRRGETRPATWRSIVAPLADPGFLRLLAFGCWFSFFNGITQAAQNIYPAKVLGISLLLMLSLKTLMRIGQFAVSPWLGRVADRLGNRAVLLATLPIVAAAPLFFLLATPQQPWWICGAWLMWIAWAGLNVCLPNLMLRLSPQRSNTPYIAAYYAITGLCMAVSTLIGGLVQDAGVNRSFSLFSGAVTLQYYAAIFLFAWLTRTAGIVLLLRIREPRDT